MAHEKAFNPFYPLLLVAGVVFALTASAYGVMTVKLLRGPGAGTPHPLIALMDEHGFEIMMWEIGALAVVTAAAIGTDSFWTRRAEKNRPQRTRDEDEKQQPETPT